MATCEIQLNLTTNGGDVPISGHLTWSDGAGLHSNVPINMPYPGGYTTFTITNANSVSITASSSGFNSATATVSCGQQYSFDLTQVGSGGGGGGGGSLGCFIVTAAYGTESAPEVELLRAFRDKSLRRTRWGSEFFEELWKYYNRVSPAIADEMSGDPELRRVLRFAIVEPWVNYMKLMISRPDFKGMDLSGLDPKLREFMLQFQTDGDKWVKSIELPKSFKGRDPMESVDELNMVLGMVLLRTEGRAYLEDMEKRGELPLQFPEGEEGKLRNTLERAGRAEDEITSILFGTMRH
jgi:hypothetical protein